MKHSTGTVTAEFAHEWELERERKLRKRFRWYAWTIIVLNAIGALAGIGLFALGFAIAGERIPINTGAVSASSAQTARDTGVFLKLQGIPVVLASLLTVAIYYYGLRFVKRHDGTRDSIIRVVIWIVFLSGVLGFATHWSGLFLLGSISPAQFLETARTSLNFATLGVQGAFGVLATHLFASFFLPWTARESLAPIWPLIYANAVLTAILAWDRPVLALALIAASTLFALPGTAVAWWKNSRFRNTVHNRALRKRYGDIKRDLTDARRIHEDLFPAPVDASTLVMRYAYQPMRQIGGDYLYARFHENDDATPERAHVIVLDVTGHGVPAALTVNRIHGEIDRQLALNPSLGPAHLLAALNDYLHLTVAARSMYATALCLHIDTTNDTVTWASAGHPPAFLRTSDNRLFHLASTTIVLGAVPPEEFEREEQSLTFATGDTILAYTDGATETLLSPGRMVRVQGLEAMLSAVRFPREDPSAADPTTEIAEKLSEATRGVPHDDTLLVQLARPIPTSDRPAEADARATAAKD